MIMCYNDTYLVHTVQSLYDAMFWSIGITEYSLSVIDLQGTDLFPLKVPLYNRIFT